MLFFRKNWLNSKIYKESYKMIKPIQKAQLELQVGKVQFIKNLKK